MVTVDMNTDTHTHTSSSSLLLVHHGHLTGSICSTADLGCCIAALHSLLFITTSCQFAILVRSLLIRSTHRRDVPPGLLFFLLDPHLRSCFCGRWSGILCRCPNHRNLFCLSCSSTGSSPVAINMSALRHLSHRVTPTMSRSHLIWKVFSLLISCWVTGQVSAP